jgi:hypothetical protein
MAMKSGQTMVDNLEVDLEYPEELHDEHNEYPKE